MTTNFDQSPTETVSPVSELWNRVNPLELARSLGNTAFNLVIDALGGIESNKG